MTLGSRDAQSIDAVRLYYERGMSQGEVAQTLGVSRPTVSKLIQFAKDQGYVEIVINDPRESANDLGDALRAEYGLRAVHVASPPTEQADMVREALGRTGARVLGDLVQDGDLLGVTWGRTLYSVARHLQHKDVRGVEVIQLKGGMSQSSPGSQDVETIQLFAKAFDAFMRFLPLPAIFDSLEVKQLVEQERHIRRVIELGREANIAVFTVGAVSADSLIFELGYLSAAEQRRVMKHAVGDICSRFLDAQGSVCDPELDARTVGIGLAELRTKQHRVLVAGGRDRVEGVRVALRAGYATELVTDRFTATKLLPG
ncbi:deoxyribonucleoside regulator [Austwickia chelonae]|uniref:Deoxyribonucleoside regulator n=1 Tax=Austwickia chelonae NBRC 105200 TaxID=1184607 RepID=K6UKN4_9MICO|nr:sugar-binding transcriptional regulator [Austwickia chelonae]GAB76541.1 deoxyribonucleoside regulator [Austwickia chelonae NBRC 105200]SEW26484.1 deoxyribonucleoside regulator [Austwickia chelonae]